MRLGISFRSLFMVSCVRGTVTFMDETLKGQDRSVYVRQQKGHSLILHLLFGGLALYIPTIYFAVSKNHYFHA